MELVVVGHGGRVVGGPVEPGKVGGTVDPGGWLVVLPPSVVGGVEEGGVVDGGVVAGGVVEGAVLVVGVQPL